MKMKILKQSPLKQIRKQCLDCCGGSRKCVRFCSNTNCPLWNFRFGKSPKAVIRENGKKYMQLFEKNNFQKGSKFDPNIEATLYKL